MDEAAVGVRRRDVLAGALVLVPAGVRRRTVLVPLDPAALPPGDVTLWARDLGSGRCVDVGGDRPRSLISLGAFLTAARVLRDLAPAELSEVVRFRPGQLVRGSPVTAWHVQRGMTVEELCDATVRRGDATAANLLLAMIGGPSGCTRFCRDLGDVATRVDRWAPACAVARPWDVRDTTTAVSIARSLARVVLGDALPPDGRRRLRSWLPVTPLPGRWRLSHVLSTGSYGSSATVGLARRGRRAVVVAALARSGQPGEVGSPATVLAAVGAALRVLDRPG